MDNIASKILGGEFQRHFWPGLFMGLLICVALYLNRFITIPQNPDLWTIVVVAIPLSVLIGVFMDVIGHVFVLTPDIRKEALQKSKMTTTVSIMAKRSISKYTDTTSLSDNQLVSELCFSLTKTINDNQPAQKKFEEQFTYFEFNRSITLFFIPLAFYILLKFLFIPHKLTTSILGYFYLIIQVIVFVLSWIVFRSSKRGFLYKIGRWYFASIFFQYNIITNLQLGILMDYFLKLESKSKTSQSEDTHPSDD